LNSSAYNDPRWNAENFARQPIDDVRRAIKFLEKRDITEYNVQSLSTAKLGAVVVGALGGKKAKASVEDFLPFDTRRIKKDSGITDATMDVFKKLMRTRRLDGRLIALLVDELKTASLRNSE
jgi:hypothetical protein